MNQNPNMISTAGKNMNLKKSTPLRPISPWPWLWQFLCRCPWQVRHFGLVMSMVKTVVSLRIDWYSIGWWTCIDSSCQLLSTVVNCCQLLSTVVNCCQLSWNHQTYSLFLVNCSILWLKQCIEWNTWFGNEHVELLTATWLVSYVGLSLQ